MRRAPVVALFVALVVLTLAGSAVAPPPINLSHSVWSTTTEFDNGTKASIDTATNSCLASGQGFQLNATGGFLGNSARCPTGSAYISRANLLASYDSSWTPAPYLRDQSGNGRSLFGNGVINVTGKIGNGIYVGNGKSLDCQAYNPGAPAPGCLGGAVLTKWSFNIFVKLNMTTCLGNVCTLLNDGVGQSSLGYIWVYATTPSLGSSAWGFQYYSGGGQALTLGSIPLDANWHAVSVRANYTNKVVQFFLDGSPVSTSSMTGTPVAPPTANRFLFVGNDAISDADSAFRSSLDELQVFNRWETNAEIAAFATAGTYASSGSWLSPRIQGNGSQLESIFLGYRNASASGSISQLQIINGTNTGVLWSSSWPGPIVSHSDNITYVDTPVDIAIPPQGIRLKVWLAGDGAHTAQVEFLGLSAEEVPVTPAITLPPTFDTNAILFMVLLVLFLGLMLAGLAFKIPALLIVSGVLGVLFGLWIWTATADSAVAFVVAILGALFVVFGGMATYGGRT